MSRKVLGLVLASVLGHALFLGLGAPRIATARRTITARATTGLGARTAIALRKVRAQEARRALIEAALRDREAGTLRLGRVLIEANRIDAEETGEAFDAEEALSRYEARRASLIEALREEEQVVLAVPKVFGDLRYYGQPGGRMGDALLDGGGSCEQVAQLVAAAVHDAGRRSEAALRFYGRPMPDGATHLAPIGVRDGQEHDLMTGKPALVKGSRIAADALIEVVARAHGILPDSASRDSASRDSASRDGAEANGDGAADAESTAPPSTRPTLAAGFPPNGDRYPGSLPLYAARAVQHPLDATDEPDDPEMASEQARHCAYFVRMAALSPVTIEIEGAGARRAGSIGLEPVRSPRPARLEREAMILRAAEDLAASPGADDADRLMSQACLASLGDLASIDFTLAGERRLANAAVEAAQRGREAGKRGLAAIHWQTEEGARTRRKLGVDYGGRTWLLLFLDGGDDVVLDLTVRATRDDWGRVSSMAALVIFPKTRARALAALGAWSLHDQVDVMHEVFHAHDHLRPWVPNYTLERPAEGGVAAERFVHAYAVFRRLAFRLWEARREAGENLDALHVDARASGLDPGWEAAMLDYYARNALGLSAQRPAGFEVVPALAAAARRNGHPSLDPLLRQLAYLEAAGRLDPRVLAEASRMK